MNASTFLRQKIQLSYFGNSKKIVIIAPPTLYFEQQPCLDGGSYVRTYTR